MWHDFLDWIEAKAPLEYRHLEWEQELAEACQLEGKGSGEVRL